MYVQGEQQFVTKCDKGRWAVHTTRYLTSICELCDGLRELAHHMVVCDR